MNISFDDYIENGSTYILTNNTPIRIHTKNLLCKKILINYQIKKYINNAFPMFFTKQHKRCIRFTN